MGGRRHALPLRSPKRPLSAETPLSRRRLQSGRLRRFMREFRWRLRRLSRRRISLWTDFCVLGSLDNCGPDRSGE
jgi:hypothetical protein